jgi:4-hydroxy-tetrahydrodipicolinate synthase
MVTAGTCDEGFGYRGVIPILPTPFDAQENVDIDSLLRLVEFLSRLGITAVTVLGVLGEAGALTDAEASTVVQELTDVYPRLDVVVGVSRPGVRNTVTAAHMAAEHGARAVMVMPPSVDGLPAPAVFDFYRDVTAATPLPVVVQDHPATSRVTMPVELLVRLIDELDAVCGVKCEAVPTATKIRALKASTQRVPIMTGLGALYAAADLAAGSDGFNTGFAFPEVLLALVAASRAGDLAALAASYRRFLPLIVTEQQPGAAIRKEIWRRRGVLDTARVRAPGAQLDPWVGEQLALTIRDCWGEADITAPLTVE